MAEIDLNSLSIAELTRRKDPNGDPAKIAEVLAQSNEILLDAPWYPANDIWSNKTVQRSSLPTGQWRAINEGVTPSSSTTNEVWDVIGLLEDYSQPDKELIDNDPDPTQARSDEDMAFVEGFAQTEASAIIYSNHFATPKQPHGLAPRLNALSQANVYGAGGTGSDLTSIYIVQWGRTKVHLTYPRNRNDFGLVKTDKGVDTVRLSTGKQYEAYVTHFQLYLGIVVKNPRCIARIANIETSGSSNIFDEDLLIEALNDMPMRGKGATIYCNATILTQMDIAAKDKANVIYGEANIWGVPTMTFRGVPVRLVEAILDTESAVS